MSQILLIDDDLGTLDTFSAILRLAGHAVTVASTGRDGVALALAAHFDAILVDLALPDISGLDVIRALHHRGTPIVLVTAVPSTQTAVAAIRLGARDYIEKPVEYDTLVHIVHTATNIACTASPAGDNQSARRYGQLPDAATESRVVMSAMKTIEERFAVQHTTVTTIAAGLRVSVEHLCRLVKRQTGHSVGYHIHRLRTQKASALLTGSHLSIKEIAYNVGYSNTNRLDYHFKRFIGIAPAALRRVGFRGRPALVADRDQHREVDW